MYVYVYVWLRLCPEDGCVCLCLYISFHLFFVSVRHLRTNIGLRITCQSVYLCLHLSSSLSIFNDKNGTQSSTMCLQEILEQQKNRCHLKVIRDSFIAVNLETGLSTCWSIFLLWIILHRTPTSESRVPFRSAWAWSVRGSLWMWLRWPTRPIASSRPVWASSIRRPRQRSPRALCAAPITRMDSSATG